MNTTRFQAKESDKNANTKSRRKITQRNQYIVNAIQAALLDVEGTPERLDVVGFDACLMSGLGAMNE